MIELDIRNVLGGNMLKKVILLFLAIGLMFCYPLFTFANEQENSVEINDNTPQTADEWLVYANSQTTASSQLSAYIDGYNLFPTDKRFIEGINKSAKSLAKWATKQHQLENYETAISRYERIRDLPELNNIIKIEVNKKLEYAYSKKTLPTKDDFVKKINRTNKASELLLFFIEGYYLYNEDEYFKDGLLKSSQKLLEWATNKHQSGSIITAKERYELILESPILSEDVKLATINRLEFSKQGKVLPTVNEIIKKAEKSNKASEIFMIFKEGSELFPGDGLVTKHLNTSACQLLKWASNKQKNKDYSIAIERYELILSVQEINKSIKKETKNNLYYAKKNLLTPNQFYDVATNTVKASEMLELFITGYRLYEGDTRFVDGINKSADTLLNWATRQHQKGQIETAQLRYNLILSAPNLKKSIKSKTERRLEYSKNGKTLPKIEEIKKKAESTYKASDILSIYLEGYYLYPESKILKDGLNKSAQLLLNWATNQHQKGQIETAQLRYDLILTVPTLDNNIKHAVEKRLEYSHNGQILPTESDFIKRAKESDKVSEIFSIYIEGYEIFFDSKDLKNGINYSAKNLLDWATNKHQAGYIEIAQSRYEHVLSAPSLSSTLKKEAEIKLNYSKAGQKLPSIQNILNRVKKNNKVSGKFDILMEGLYIYPRNKIIQNEINRSAQKLLDWTSKQHQKGNYNIAIERYNKIIDSTFVESNIKARAKTYLDYAHNNKKIYTVTNVVNPYVSKYSYNKMVKDINTLVMNYPLLITTEIIGKSVDGRNIYAVKLGHGEKEIFINGAHHAREHMTTNLLMEMIDEYAQSYALSTKIGKYNTREILDKVSIWFVPMVSPDGVMLVQQGASSAKNPSRVIAINNGSKNFSSWKANIRGVDLNRQYPADWANIRGNTGKPTPDNYKGTKPLTEPEVKAIYNFTNKHDFKTAVAYHSSGQIIYWYFHNKKGALTRDKKIANTVSNITGYSLVKPTPNPSGGGYTDWIIIGKGIPGLTIEISPYTYGKPVPLKNWPSIWKKNKVVGLYLAKEASNR
jgi:murein tripeptide amidase MpaA